jgi:hypothetical protein
MPADLDMVPKPLEIANTVVDFLLGGRRAGRRNNPDTITSAKTRSFECFHWANSGVGETALERKDTKIIEESKITGGSPSLAFPWRIR